MNISLKDIINDIKNDIMLNEINKEPVEVIDNKFQIEDEEVIGLTEKLLEKVN